MTTEGGDGLLALLEHHDSAAVMMSPGPVEVGLARLAESVILDSPRVVILARRPDRSAGVGPV